MNIIERKRMINRRNFLKQTGATTAALALGGTASLSTIPTSPPISNNLKSDNISFDKHTVFSDAEIAEYINNRGPVFDDYMIIKNYIQNFNWSKIVMIRSSKSHRFYEELSRSDERSFLADRIFLTPLLNLYKNGYFIHEYDNDYNGHKIPIHQRKMNRYSIFIDYEYNGKWIRKCFQWALHIS